MFKLIILGNEISLETIYMNIKDRLNIKVQNSVSNIVMCDLL